MSEPDDAPPNDPTQQPPRGLFTAEELVTLQKYLPQFLQIRRTPGMKLLGFWELLERDFFHDHPFRDLTEEEIAKGMTQATRLARLRQVSKLL